MSAIRFLTAAAMFCFCITSVGAQEVIISQSVADKLDKPQKGEFGKLLIDPKIAESQLVHRVPPRYPQNALIAKIQGDVVIHALIDKNGHVSRVKAEKGHPMLLQSAMTAVSQWRYEPFLLSGEPMEVETSVLVTFRPEK